jgi:ComF family protein
VSCRTPFQNAFPLDASGRCALCRTGQRGFDIAWCFGAYEGTLRGLIQLYKYAKVRTLVRPLGEMLHRALPRDEAFDAIVPVPLHWTRRLRRGFNQSADLARTLSRRTGIPMLKALGRVRPTATQAGLSNTARRRNVTRAFRSLPLPASRILLIDDVLTTGATAAACAMALKQAGARRVAVLTVARVDRRADRWRLPSSGRETEDRVSNAN